MHPDESENPLGPRHLVWFLVVLAIVWLCYTFLMPAWLWLAWA